MKHHNTHTNIRDFTVWKTHRMKHGSRSEVTDRVEKMPTPYLKANKRNSRTVTLKGLLIKKQTNKKNKLKKKPPVSFAFQLLFQIFLSTCASMWSEDNVWSVLYLNCACHSTHIRCHSHCLYPLRHLTILHFCHLPSAGIPGLPTMPSLLSWCF